MLEKKWTKRFLKVNSCDHTLSFIFVNQFGSITEQWSTPKSMKSCWNFTFVDADKFVWLFLALITDFSSKLEVAVATEINSQLTHNFGLQFHIATIFKIRHFFSLLSRLIRLIHPMTTKSYLSFESWSLVNIAEPF